MSSFEIYMYLGFLIFLLFIAFVYRNDIKNKISRIGFKNLPKYYLSIFSAWLIRGLIVGIICLIINLLLYSGQSAIGVEHKFYIVPRGW